ncbi:MAG: hypothetical protein RQ728_10090 [Brevefilum sp.]|nr:hypothetical protein [Brevefilum sp.]MDT8382586.1 hypothetical protein [Brevefilum sp.]MDW7754761.1 hypothetical protein [Brevefilum sp.]
MKFLHWFIIFIFILEIGYGLYMVFFVVGGSRWPLMARAVETPIEIILKRRLYAIETWIAIAGLAVYLALTEFLPILFDSYMSNPKTTPLESYD